MIRSERFIVKHVAVIVVLLLIIIIALQILSMMKYKDSSSVSQHGSFVSQPRERYDTQRSTRW